MFSGIPQKNRAVAESYFDEHLSHNDYYTQGEKQAGHWIGSAAEKLGLQQGEVVTREAFLCLCDNQHPHTREQLTPQQFRARRIYFDFVCSPPKSVSILAVTMNDRRIIEAHKEASLFALRELEQFAAARIRKGGIEDRDRITGNLVGAAFVHTTSRALAVYRNELAKRLHQLGYSIRRTGTAFEIAGVEPELLERFSKRSQQRDMAVEVREQKLGRKLTKQEVSHVVHQSRPKKLKGASDEQVRRQQLGEIGFFEKRALRKAVERANGLPVIPAETVTESDAVRHGLDHVFERNSVVPQQRILEAALVRGCGQLDLAQLKETLANDESLVRVGSQYSTRQILNRELYLIRSVNAAIESVAPVTRFYEPPVRLGPDQRKALAHVLTSPDRFTGFRGLAGSGKSTVLVEMARVLHREGFEPIFCAPTASAADTLRKDGLDAMTLPKLLSDPNARAMLSPRSVIVLDEAGAVGLDDMTKLFEAARLTGCRVVLSGDTGQHASVARGDALRILEQYSSYRFSELTTIRRQKPQAFRQIVELAAAKQTDRAFAKLLEIGAVTETLTDDGELYQRAADAYLSATKQGKSALLVSPTWMEIDAVTEKLRDTLKAQGVIGPHEEAVRVFDSLSWTEAQKKNANQFQPGQRLRFVRQTKRFERGETVEVVAVVDQPGAGHNTLRVRRADGSETLFQLGAGSACFDVGEARELKVAAGDWLLLQANHGNEFINGERVRVQRLAGGAITLIDGRVLPADYRTFTHGYAVTSHSSQGKTVDEVLLVASSRSFAAVNREQFYVSISRGRARVHVFTDDAELLSRRVTDSHERQAAVELLALRQELAKLGFSRTDRLKEKVLAHGHQPPASTARQDFRTVRLMRPVAVRQHRTTRLSPVQRLVQVAQQVRRWMGEHFGPAQTESVKQLEKARRSLREEARQRIEQHRQQRQQPRHSRGIGH